MTTPANNKPKSPMKINRSEFKSVVKECLRELVAEGAFSQTLREVLSEAAPQQQQMPRMIVPQPQSYGSVMESVLADTLRVSIPQMQAAERAMLPTVGFDGPVSMPLTEQQQHFAGGGAMPRNPLPPREAQQLPVQQAANPWARLAFNKPISNRPPGGAGANGSHLPGVNKGGF